MGGIDVAVARQPILDRAGEVYGYELLFRHVDEVAAKGLRPDGDVMTSTVLFSSMAIGIERLVGSDFLFCNADVGLLTGAVPMLLPPGQTVVEVLETVVPDELVLAGCRRLVEQGYRLALDDFVWFEGCEPLLELASIVKIDVQEVCGADLIELVRRCREYDVELLAEKVETAEELALCEALDFDMFQGYLFSRPRLVPGRTLGSTSPGRLRLAAEMIGRDLDLDEVEELVRADPAASYQLLRLASIGAGRGLRREIKTLREALVMVGSRRMQNWFVLLLLTRSGETSRDGLVATLTRARMVEQVASVHDPPLAGLGFTAGMVSAFDLLLGVSAEQVAEELALEKGLRAAAFGSDTWLGQVVRDVVDHQNGRPAQRSGVSVLELDLVAVDALVWAMDLVAQT